MQRLVDDLLLLARTDLKTIDEDWNSVDIDDLLLAQGARIRGNSSLDVSTSRVSGGQVKGDEADLDRAIRNLIDNAERHASEQVSISLIEENDWVVLTVEDDGEGIPDSQRDSVFERFSRNDESRSREQGGAGLGLAIAREIFETHGGTVTIVEGTLVGASFEVRLPVDPDDRAQEADR